MCDVYGVLLEKALSLGYDYIATGHYAVIKKDPVSGRYLLYRAADSSKDQDLFAGLSSGDKILVIHGLIMESYPGQTHAYYCLRLEAGSLADIPQDVLERLREMGWLEEAA